MATTVYTLLERVKLQLMEETGGTDGIRWRNAELVDWLTEFYLLACLHLPGKFSERFEFVCVAGTRQTIPDTVSLLLEITRNLDGDMMALSKVERSHLDSTRRRWHAERSTLEQELWCFDDQMPREFFVYPPAKAGSKLELYGSVLPGAHVVEDYTGATELVRCPEELLPAALDYILSRCYSKDSEDQINTSREQNHLNKCLSMLGLTDRVALKFSPNNPAND